jgi:carbon monoxide dehydrogenase subunit G
MAMRGERTTEIAAPPERVYAVVSDLTRMGEFSPECRSVEWLDGATGPAPGSRFVGRNGFGLVRWSRHGRVVSADAGREFSFVTEEGGRDSTLWTFRLRAAGSGTLVTESYQVRWIPWWMHALDAITFRRQQLAGNMATTLARLKTAVESPSAR